MKNEQPLLTTNSHLELGLKENAKSILLLGYTQNYFGHYSNEAEIVTDEKSTETFADLTYIINRVKDNCVFYIVGDSNAVNYYNLMFNYLVKLGAIKSREAKRSFKTHTSNDQNDLLNFMNKLMEKEMKFDYIIQKPPYAGQLHIEFFKMGLNLLANDGYMTMIEPSTWLINLKKSGNAKLFSEVKSLVAGHVRKIQIENMNKEFNIGSYVPLALTYIDFSKTYNEFEFSCFGEKHILTDLNDANMVGSYKTIWSIFDKVRSKADVMNNHITTKVFDPNLYYMPYCGILSAASYNTNSDKIQTKFGIYRNGYIQPVVHTKVNTPEHFIPKNKINNDFLCTYGTKEELENWKYFAYNNKLSLFINCCLSISQHNYSKEFLPWLVDKRYTDEEINQLFGFTDEEIQLIDKTIKKFEYNTPWFKRYLSGKDSVSDDEIQKFIKSL